MIKARAGQLAIFGLSEMNLRKLREGKPIRIDMRELGFPEGPAAVLILYGKTEQDMERDLREFIGPNTEYRNEIN